MASNSFGDIFRITTFGESHGSCIGVVIDGCPPNLYLSEEKIERELSLRAPGKSPFTSPRKEPDKARILSGVFEGKTTGAPIAILIENKDANPSSYQKLKEVFRPGHANFTYLEKYGHFDYRGGGRASARETAARVAAGAVAKILLECLDLTFCTFVRQIGGISIENLSLTPSLRKKILQSPLFCPDPKAEKKMMQALMKTKEEGDSLGGIVEGVVFGLPPGLGDPQYGKLEALLASAMMSIPASKGFSIGSGFEAAKMKGSEHNDPFTKSPGKTNHAGGILGGISTGDPLIFRVAFKPTSSIQKPQETLTLDGQKQILTLPEGSRHDPCIAIRASIVVEAMCALVLADVFCKQIALKTLSKSELSQNFLH